MKAGKLTHFLRVLLVFGVVFVSCKPELIEVVIEEHEDGSPRTIKYFDTRVDEDHLVKEIQLYENGDKKYEGEFVNGKKHGKWIFWFENGKLWSEGSFDQNLRSGKTKVYHKNGKLYYKGKYEDGKKHGNWEFYNNSGELVNEVVFEYGEILKQSAKPKLNNIDEN